MGDGFTGDIAVDDLSFMDCTLYPGKREHINTREFLFLGKLSMKSIFLFHKYPEMPLNL